MSLGREICGCAVHLHSTLPSQNVEFGNMVNLLFASKYGRAQCSITLVCRIFSWWMKGWVRKPAKRFKSGHICIFLAQQGLHGALL